MEGSTVSWYQEVVICRDACFADKESTASNEPIITVHPYVKVLMRFVTREGNMQTLNHTSTLRGRE